MLGFWMVKYSMSVNGAQEFSSQQSFTRPPPPEHGSSKCFVLLVYTWNWLLFHFSYLDGCVDLELLEA